MPGCSAFGCSNRDEKGFKTFRFPKDEITRQEWIKRVNRINFYPTQYARLCECHFTPECFWNLEERKLRKDAIPTLFLQGSNIHKTDDVDYAQFEESLMSMENIDRSSPELWPEKFPGIAEFMNTYTPVQSTKAPYSREFTAEDNNYITHLASLSTSGLISKVKELHDIAYQLGVEEAKEMTRGKYLNIFNKPKHAKK